MFTKGCPVEEAKKRLEQEQKEREARSGSAPHPEKPGQP